MSQGEGRGGQGQGHVRRSLEDSDPASSTGSADSVIEATQGHARSRPGHERSRTTQGHERSQPGQERSRKGHERSKTGQERSRPLYDGSGDESDRRSGE
jgi:hypothetical protein